MPPPAHPDPAAALAAEEDVALFFGLVEEIVRGGELGSTRRYFAPDCVAHGERPGARGDGLVESLAARRTRFPDAVWTIELLAGVGGLVVCHTSVIAPGSGAAARGSETVVVRIAAGRIVESWRVRDGWLRSAEEDGAV